MNIGWTRLYVLVEGLDDKRFFEGIMKPLLEEKHDSVIVREYAQRRPLKVRKFIQAIKAMNDRYIFVADINEAPCVTARKHQVQGKFTSVDEDRVMVTIREIESWYLGGLDHTNCGKLGVPHTDTTDSITKEQFDAFIPKRFGSRKDFMLEILKCFSMETAKRKNKSLEYFVEKYDC